ncbi:hypothetical protein HPB50_026119 [Hyalomma asiaticum]|uniref:Uncharacterized protein n=1 Tax=Hyalomma asiaticum TaxID=266040 RepID=A0ACB7TR73_HYAAI|nr:hypothetical protein HPB50_026119 [Hyalomma asiaticum]
MLLPLAPAFPFALRRRYNLIAGFLEGRSYQVEIGQVASAIRINHVGVPQGSVISPTLFNIAMYQLPRRLADVPGLKHAVYADDVTVWTHQGSIEDPAPGAPAPRLRSRCYHPLGPRTCGIHGNEKAHRLARAHLSTALARASDTHFPLLATPAELADPMADKHIAKQRRAAYLTAVGNPLSIPSIPSKVFTRRESVLLRRVQTGTLLTPFLLNRFHRGGTPPPVTGFCSTCSCRADLNHLCWECPLYI